MNKYEEMIEQMAQELVKDQLKGFAEKRAAEILKGLNGEQKPHIRGGWKVASPMNSMLSLSLKAPADIAREGSNVQKVWEAVYVLVDKPMRRSVLTKKLHEVHPDMTLSNISSLISGYVKSNHLVVSKPSSGA
jgi:hypothetical protein